MASGIETTTDIVYNNAKNEVPWHSLGVPLDGLGTVMQIKAASPAAAAPVLKVPAQLDGKDVPGHYFTIRADDRRVLGHVGEEYQVLQNEKLLEVMAALVQDPNGPVFETAGVLWGGRRFWCLARFPETMVLKGRNGQEDHIVQYLLGLNSHDGSSRIRVMETAVRVVCANTEAMALRQAKRNTSAWVCHSGDLTVKLDNVADTLGIAAKEFAETQELYQALLNVEPTREQIDAVMARLIPDTKSDRAKLQRGRVMELAEVGAGNAPFAGTAWALYNCFTELSDHVNNQGSKRADKADMRLNSAWFGSGMSFKAEALKAIAETCLN